MGCRVGENESLRILVPLGLCYSRALGKFPVTQAGAVQTSAAPWWPGSRWQAIVDLGAWASSPHLRGGHGVTQTSLLDLTVLAMGIPCI